MCDHLADPGVPIIAGHSHAACLGVPQKTEGGKSQIVALSSDERRFCGFSGAWPRRAPFWSDLVAVARGRTIILVWGGNAHNIYFLLTPGRPLDFVLHEEPNLAVDAGALVVPDLAIEAKLRAGLHALCPTIEGLLARGAERVVVCGTPPPKASLRITREGILRERGIRRSIEAAGFRPKDVPLSSARFRYKAWRVIQRNLRRDAERASAEFFPVPVALLEDGMLPDRYSTTTDATHANAEYGRSFLNHLHAYLRRGQSWKAGIPIETLQA